MCNQQGRNYAKEKKKITAGRNSALSYALMVKVRVGIEFGASKIKKKIRKLNKKKKHHEVTIENVEILKKCHYLQNCDYTNLN